MEEMEELQKQAMENRIKELDKRMKLMREEIEKVRTKAREEIEEVRITFIACYYLLLLLILLIQLEQY